MIDAGVTVAGAEVVAGGGSAEALTLGTAPALTIGAGVDAAEVAVAGAGAGCSRLTFPTENPASFNVLVTLPRGWPTKLGVTYVSGDALSVTSRFIFGAETPVAS